jgi:hypothetical protein
MYAMILILGEMIELMDGDESDDRLEEREELD